VLACHCAVCVCVCVCVHACMHMRMYVHSTHGIKSMMLSAGQTILHCMVSVTNELGKNVEGCGCGSVLISVTVLSPACRD
jgi:L-asparaginase II